VTEVLIMTKLNSVSVLKLKCDALGKIRFDGVDT